MKGQSNDVNRILQKLFLIFLSQTARMLFDFCCVTHLYVPALLSNSDNLSHFNLKSAI